MYVILNPKARITKSNVFSEIFNKPYTATDLYKMLQKQLQDERIHGTSGMDIGEGSKSIIQKTYEANLKTKEHAINPVNEEISRK